MFMTNQQATELSEPDIGSLHNPTASITSQLASIFIAPRFVVGAVGHDEFNAWLPQAAAQRIGVVSHVGNHPLRLLSRAALRSREADFGARGLRKRNFTGGGTFQPNSQRKTFTVDQYHPLRA